MMFDLKAPILPCVGVAGITLGTSITDFAKTKGLQIGDFSERLESGDLICRFQSVTLWIVDQKINQISVHHQYKGKLRSNIHIGMPKSSVEQRYGKFELDEEDNLVIPSIEGICFEFDVESRLGEITEIFVYLCD